MALNVTNTTPYFKQALYIGEARITLAALWGAIVSVFGIDLVHLWVPIHCFKK